MAAVSSSESCQCSKLTLYFAAIVDWSPSHASFLNDMTEYVVCWMLCDLTPVLGISLFSSFGSPEHKQAIPWRSIL